MTPDIITHGSDARLAVCREALLRLPSPCAARPYSAIHLLPIPSTRDGRLIRTTDTPLDALLTEGAAIVGYALPTATVAEAARRGCTVCDVATDETFILENARLTAVGTVGYLLTHTDRAPEELSVGVIGYGRIGRELCRLLLFLGAHVRVYTGREHVRHALGACGVETRDSSTEDGSPLAFDGLDVLINTAPSPGRIREESPFLPPLILELASGSNIEEAVPFTALPSLPSVMFPTSAAEAYARAAARALRGTDGGEGHRSPI